MQDKRTLFDYLYQNLRKQILTGQFAYGSALPSMSQICEIYHVGIRTAKDVLHALKEEGLIRTQERKPAVVIYQCTQNGTVPSSIPYILRCRTAIEDAYRTLEIIMPILLSFSVSVSDVRSMEHYAYALAYSKKPHSKNDWRTANFLLHDVLHASGNLLFTELYSSLQVDAHAPFFAAYGSPSGISDLQNIQGYMTAVINALNKSAPQDTKRCFQDIYREITAYILCRLEEFSLRFPNVKADPKISFVWHAERGRDHYYTQIARDLINKIGTGEYPSGSYLPAEAMLAKQYGVSVSTVRKALSMLNQLGFGQTINAKGTLVLMQDDQATFHCLKDKTFRHDTLLYLSGLQLMALLIGPAALRVFDRITPREISTLKDRFAQPQSIPLKHIFTCIMNHLDLQPYRTILSEINKLLLWGYYFSFYSGKSDSTNQLNLNSLKAFHCLQAGDADGFASGLSSCYCHILTVVRSFLIKYGLPEAVSLRTPPVFTP